MLVARGQLSSHTPRESGAFFAFGTKMVIDTLPLPPFLYPLVSLPLACRRRCAFVVCSNRLSSYPFCAFRFRALLKRTAHTRYCCGSGICARYDLLASSHGMATNMDTLSISPAPQQDGVRVSAAFLCFCLWPVWSRQCCHAALCRGVVFHGWS